MNCYRWWTIILLMVQIPVSAIPKDNVYFLDSICANHELCYVQFKNSGTYGFSNPTDTIKRIVIKPRFPKSILDISKATNVTLVQIFSQSPNCSMLQCNGGRSEDRNPVNLTEPETDAFVTCCYSVTSTLLHTDKLTTATPSVATGKPMPLVITAATASVASRKLTLSTSTTTSSVDAIKSTPPMTAPPMPSITTRKSTVSTSTATSSVVAIKSTPPMTAASMPSIATRKSTVSTSTATTSSVVAIKSTPPTSIQYSTNTHGHSSQPTSPPPSITVIALAVTLTFTFIVVIILIICHRLRVLRIRRLHLPLAHVSLESPSLPPSISSPPSVPMRRSLSDSTLNSTLNSTIGASPIFSPTPLIPSHRYPTRFQKRKLEV